MVPQDERGRRIAYYVELRKIYNKTFIRWTTHNPPGLSMKDIQMAKYCDEQAIVLGEVQIPSGTRDQTAHIRDLADQVAMGSGDCCTSRI
jgi:4a-hydroxytetrahydrobiopterin dehydratase